MKHKSIDNQCKRLHYKCMRLHSHKSELIRNLMHLRQSSCFPALALAEQAGRVVLRLKFNFCEVVMPALNKIHSLTRIRPFEKVYVRVENQNTMNWHEMWSIKCLIKM